MGALQMFGNRALHQPALLWNFQNTILSQSWLFCILVSILPEKIINCQLLHAVASIPDPGQSMQAIREDQARDRHLLLLREQA